MKKNIYQEIINEVSEKISNKIIGEEKNLTQRAILIDKDISEIVQEIGLKTTKKVLENTRDEIVKKKEKKKG
jgi:hypothetical protein